MKRLQIVAWVLALALLCGTAARADASFTLPAETLTGPGGDAVVPVALSPADGALSLDLVLAFDPAVLAVSTVYRTNLTAPFAMYWNVDTPGMLRISLYGTAPLAGSGPVAWVYFRGIGAPGTGSNLTWVTHEINEGQLPSTATGGHVSLTGSQFLRAPKNANGAPGTHVHVPLTAETANGFLGVDLALTWDPAVLAAVNVRTTALTDGWTLFFNNTVPGELLVSLYGTQPASGSGPLVDVEFVVLGTIGTLTPLDLVTGTVNEGTIPTILDDGLFSVCADADGDGVTVCGGDCDDTNAAVHPGAPEVCDGVDNQCPGDPGYGQVDEDFVPAVTHCGIGACAATGSTSCVAGHVHDSCTPGLPVPETCNGVDDDCSGTADDGLAPVPSTCGVGACAAAGVITCSGGTTHDSCVAGHPALETCNGIDDDCDGTVDNGIAPVPSACGVGACASTGLVTCSGGAPHDSCVAGLPTVETCNGIDDNCDGTPDNGIVPVASTCGVGACASTGTISCIAGSLHDSCAAGLPSTESCNGIDDDCDATVDNGIAPVPSTCGVGACASAGVIACIGGALSDSCIAGTPVPETCNGVDDNCNGFVDEGFDADGDGVADCFDNCVGVPNSGQADGDGDHCGDACDQAPLDGAVRTLPVDSLDVTRSGGDAVVSWAAGTVTGTFNVYRGFRRSGSPWSYDQSCLATEIAGTSVSDGVSPIPANAFFYLVSRKATCGESSLGSTSAGAPIPNSNACPSTGGDADGDGVADWIDDCPAIANADQADADHDGYGDLCDNCPAVANPNQADSDLDGLGNACDPDYQAP